VEGYSSPLWMLVMVPFQVLPIAWGKVSLAFMIFCAGLLLTNLVLLDRLLERRWGVKSIPVRLGAAFSLAFLYPMNYWTLEGMEPGPQVTLFLLGLDYFMAFEESRAPRYLNRLGVVLAMALLLRMDMVFFVGWVVLLLGPWLLQNRMAALKFLAIVGLPIAAYLVFRLVYFHDLLPNTYYLKLYQIPMDIRLERGWHYFSQWAERLWLVWILMAVAVIPILGRKATWLTLLLIFTYLAYNVYIGGDAWEEAGIGANRFTVIVLPLVMVLLAAGGNAWGAMLRGGPGQWMRYVLPTVGCLLLTGVVNGILFMPEGKNQWDKVMVREWPYNTEYQMWNTMKALDMNDWVGPGGRVASVQAGGIGYFAACELVDFLGFNDRHIARLKPYWDAHTTEIHDYVPGHAKVDYAYAIGELQPDFIIDKWTKFSPGVDQQFNALLAAGGYEKHPRYGWVKVNFQRKD
jgi:hypothetical protein